jgi:hypothetical protein
MPPSTRNSRANGPGWTLEERDEAFIDSLMPLWEWLYRYYFRVQTSGWESIPEGQVLLVGSHNGGLSAPDMHMMMYDWFRRFGVDRPVYGLMHADLSQSFIPGTTLAVKAGAIMAHPTMAHKALQSGASVLVYPGGVKDLFRPHDQRDRICFNNSALRNAHCSRSFLGCSRYANCPQRSVSAPRKTPSVWITLAGRD